MERAGMRIGELARRADCAVETIRYYEREGLLPAPARTGGNYRTYAERHLERLAFIRRCRSLDMTQEEIRALLSVHDAPESDCTEANALLDEHIEHVGERIAQLKALREELRALRALCSRSRAAKDCRILKELSMSDGKHPHGTAGSAQHVHGAHPGGRKR